MNVLEKLNESKIGRKKFLFITGLIAAGGFLLAKIPFKLFTGRTDKYFSDDIRLKVRENPGSVKRTNV
jgi:hypothetical protein